MKSLILCITATMILSTSAFARGKARACVDADVVKENLGLVMGILNKNELRYRVVKITGSKKYNVAVQVSSSNLSSIKNKLLNLSELEILKEEGINFSSSEFGRCFGNLEDVTKI